METIHRADLNTVRIFAFDTILGNYEWHLISPILVNRPDYSAYHTDFTGIEKV